MKTSITIIWSGVLALLLGPGAAQAQPDVIFEPGTSKAIGIDNLDVDSVTYEVVFTDRTNPQSVYGDFPGVLDFDNESSAGNAHDAVDAALNGEGAVLVGAEGESGETSYVVGYDTTTMGPDQLFHLASSRGGSWERIPGQDTMPWRSLFPATKVFATFTVPEPGTALSLVAALAPLGLVARWRRVRRG